MLCVIPHICKDVLEYSYVTHIKQVNNVVKILLCVLSDDKMNQNIDILWSDYTGFNNNNGHFDVDDFICKIKDIQ